MEPPQSQSRVGETIAGRYALKRRIGVGGYSSVYEASHTVTGRLVALKLLHAHLLIHQEIIDRFLQEARAMSGVKHEGIVQVLDAGIDSVAGVYIALELLEGQSLELMLHQQKTLPWPVAALYCAQILDALSEAHRHQIIHRDIKPGNIFVTLTLEETSSARLLDFGIALVAQQKRITAAGMILGTPEYMSPEQCQSPMIGPEADLWAVGIVMWECLTGRTPYVAETDTATLLRVMSNDTYLIRDTLPELPVALAAVIDRALERSLEKRWRTAAEMRDGLLRVLRRNGGPEGAVAARMATRSSSRVQAVQSGQPAARRSDPEVVDLSAVAVDPSEGGPGVPLTSVVIGRVAVRSSVPARAPSNPPGEATSSQPPPAPAQRPPFDTKPGLALTLVERLAVASPSRPPTLAEPIETKEKTPAKTFALEELSEEERAARTFTGDRATFQPPPQSDEAPKRRMVLYVAAVVLILTVGVAEFFRTHSAPSVRGAEVRHTAAREVSSVSFASQLGVEPPTVVDDAVEFARHAVAGVSAKTSQRIFASCIPTSNGANLIVRAMAAGAQRLVASGLVTCAGASLGIVSDVTGDGIEDIVAIGAVLNTVVVIDSTTLHVVQSATVEGVRGIATGTVVDTLSEQMVVVFAEPAGPSQPTEIRALQTRSLTELWRYRSETENARVGHPEELGLAVGPDTNHDNISDVLMGMGAVLGAPSNVRCVQLLSGINGRPLWPAPLCHASTGENQTVSLGHDVNGDEIADLVVGTVHPVAGDVSVTVLSGADASVLRRITTPEGTYGFGSSVSLGGDLDGDRRSDVVISARGAFYVFDALSGTRRGRHNIPGATDVLPRVLVVPPLRADAVSGVLVATAVDGIRVYTSVESGL
jgi:eukaryotic-like serine/threonine-protein kinase